MKKRFTTLLLLTFMSFFACESIIIEPENGIRATGDYAGFLTTRIIQTPASPAVLWQLTSVTDSTNITYPTFSLSLNQTKGSLVVQLDARKPLKYYYAVNHQINVNNLNDIEINDITFVSGGGISASNEIISPDDTKTIILNGRLKL